VATVGELLTPIEEDEETNGTGLSRSATNFGKKPKTPKV
jgi:hypothetical protein